MTKKARELGVAGPYELDQKLQRDHGTSLAMLRTQFENSSMAEAYLDDKMSKAEREATRAELLAYYEKHLDDYSFPASVKWQQIEVSFRKHGGKREAFAVFEKVVEALKSSNGADFSEVAKKFSDGARAEQGGQWDWTRQGSLSDKNLDKLLFEVPVGAISAPIVGDDAFRLVKINERKLAGRVPFSEVQEEIKKAIKKSRIKLSSADVLAELRARTLVQTIFDKDAKKSNDVLPFQ